VRPLAGAECLSCPECLCAPPGVGEVTNPDKVVIKAQKKKTFKVLYAGNVQKRRGPGGRSPRHALASLRDQPLVARMDGAARLVRFSGEIAPLAAVIR